jgi:RNA polymerase sigma-70 factor (ECF subfamily)
LPAADEALIGRVFRDEYGRCVATLIRAFGDIDLVEDAVQDAFSVALCVWPAGGVPPNPGGWITTTARRRAIDRLRRESRRGELQAQGALLDQAGTDPLREGPPVQDDRLRLIFTCCHPALSTDAQIALTLRLLGGLSTEHVARAFLVPTQTMAKRLVRAKRKIKAASIPYRIPAEAELPERLRPVLAVLYLIYNAGADGPAGGELCREAIRLARAIARLMPDEQEVAGLLALLLLTESRRAARFWDGALVLLAEQDRSRWDAGLIEEGTAIVAACVRRNRPGIYQLQAAINAVHANAGSIEATDWRQILALYDHLLALSPTPVVALNRAIALAEVQGPSVALALVEELELDGYHLLHATRAELLLRLGRRTDAGVAFSRAAQLAPTPTDRAFLLRRLETLGLGGTARGR